MKPSPPATRVASIVPAAAPVTPPAPPIPLAVAIVRSGVSTTTLLRSLGRSGRRFASAEALALHRLNALDATVKGALEHGLL